MTRSTMSKPEVVILGAGNVATHLAEALSSKARITQIYNHNLTGAEELAGKIGATAIDSIDNLSQTADFYIISIKDDAIKPLAAALGERRGIWCHTSGSVSIDSLSTISKTTGVIYPMQTFSKDVAVEMSEVPFFIEGSTDAVTGKIKALAELISKNAHEADSDTRAKLHIAAVFACNFTNRLWDISSKVLEPLGLDFSVLGPLVKATLDKAVATSPHSGQTGPARRNDLEIIRKHVNMLQGEERTLYCMLSDSIINQYHKK